MKFKWLNRILSCVLALSLLIATPVYARETDGTGSGATAQISPLAKYFDASQLNPDYVEWLENGKQGLEPSTQDFSYLAKSYARLSAMRNALLPEEYDLRDYGLVEPVPNQGELGICWAVAANSAAASTLLEQFPQTALSSIHTAWFTYNGPEEKEMWNISGTAEDAFYIGGNDGRAVGTMAAWKGPISNEQMPLHPDDQEIPDESLRYEADYHLQDAYYMTNGIYFDLDEYQAVANDITKQIIMETGAVTVGYYSSDMSGAYNPETNAWYNSEAASIDHAVLVVGWDDNFKKENFLEGNRPEKNGAWLIRNSWGDDWGDDGYFWLSYEDKTLMSGTAYVLEEADNYEKNYQYDTIGWSYSLSTNVTEPTKAKAANIFTAESNEMLEAVSFYTTDANTRYTVSVYTGVSEGQPETGTAYRAVQSGTEPYAGYHTIELDTPIPLKAGEKFSIVVELENPTYESPLAIEWCPMQSEDFVPQYLGNGGESYVFSENEWRDVAGEAEGFYITNVCIKGFTNPLPASDTAVPTVRFSEMEGPLAAGTNIELTAGDADIYYSVNGGAYQQYQAPLNYEGQEKYTVSAYAVIDGKQGNTAEKTYTKALAQFTELVAKSKDGIHHFDTDPEKIYEFNGTHDLGDIHLPYFCDSVQVKGLTGDGTFTVDGATYQSNVYTDPISLEPNESRTVVIEIQGSNKEPTKYKFEVFRSMMRIDYEAETIHFDESKYIIEDKNGNKIENGGSISYLISDQEKTIVEVIPKDGARSYEEYIPARPALTGIGVDYVKEQTDVAFSDAYAYSENADMSDKVQCQNGAFIPVEPGKDLYIQRQATDTQFAGTVFHLEVPERPAAPTVEAAEITETSVTLKEVEGAMYSCGDGEWQESPVFTGLVPGTEYQFKAYLPATEEAFCSETGTAALTTAIPAVNPSDYSFEVKYVDGEGNPVPGGGVIKFDKTGPYSREDIPLPYGYMAVVPAHPDNDWLYPTALEFIDGAWMVTNPVVEFMVEPMAKVDIIFKTPDGNVLEDLGYTRYYSIECVSIGTVPAPEGYELISSNAYMVDVFRDEDGKLVADPSEIVYWVKQAGTEIPVNPSDYSFEVKYVDSKGNPIQGGGTITFDKAGPYSREDIPLPYGYMAVVPAHPDNDWLYPTALEWKDGRWFVTNPVVEIMVEPMAAVDIIFKTPDGKVLEDLGYTKYYDSIGARIETVTAPEGYEFIDGNTYAVEITRGADGKLIADPTEVEFVVKAVGSGEPSEPEDPSKPSAPSEPTQPQNPIVPTQPNGDVQSPDTGDNSNRKLWVALMVASAGAIFIVFCTNRRKKKAIE